MALAIRYLVDAGYPPTPGKITICYRKTEFTMFSSAVAFRMESREFFDELELLLLKISKDHEDIKQAERIFQNFHAIKGLCSLFGLNEITFFIQRLEALYLAVSKQEIRITEELIHATREARDHILQTLEAHSKEEIAAAKQKTAEILQAIDKLEAPGTGGTTHDEAKVKRTEKKTGISKSGSVLMPSRGKTARVLIVDDDDINRTILEGFVLNACNNAEVVSVSSGEEAIFQIFTSWFDLVLLDIMMPVMDGNMVLNIIEKNITAGNIVKLSNIVVQTAVSSMGELLTITKRDCVQEVLRKPVKFERIRDCIERYCVQVN